MYTGRIIVILLVLSIYYIAVVFFPFFIYYVVTYKCPDTWSSFIARREYTCASYVPLRMSMRVCFVGRKLTVSPKTHSGLKANENF